MPKSTEKHIDCEDEVPLVNPNAQDLLLYLKSKAIGASAICSGSFTTCPYITVGKSTAAAASSPEITRETMNAGKTGSTLNNDETMNESPQEEENNNNNNMNRDRYKSYSLFKKFVFYLDVGGQYKTRSLLLKDLISEIRSLNGRVVSDVNDEDVTHIIFVDGQVETINLAKERNIPVVTPLWIDRCKKKHETIDTKKYEIHDGSSSDEEESEHVKQNLMDPIPITIPVMEQLGQKLIEEGYCQQAPFGRGMETVIDTNVRRAWQIDSGNVQIHGTDVHDLLCSDSRTSSLLETIRSTLVPNVTRISSKFYKLLVYRQGDFFKAHKDTQRSKNHFGSLVIFLPSVYSGGELLVRHKGKQQSFSNSMSQSNNQQWLKCTWVAFFTDCEHEILPLQDGCRIALAFNLYSHGNIPPQIPESPDIRLRKYMNNVFTDLDSTSYRAVGVLLQHHYTLASLEPEYLKGNDLLLYNLFHSMQDRYNVELKSIRVELSGISTSNSIRQKDMTDYIDNEVSYMKVIGDNEDLELFKYDYRQGYVYFLFSADFLSSDFKNMKDVSTGSDEGQVTGNTGSYSYDLEYAHAAMIISLKDDLQLFSEEPTDNFVEDDAGSVDEDEDDDYSRLNLDKLTEFSDSLKRKDLENAETNTRPSKKRKLESEETGDE
jgi:hypothetical protein